MRDYKVGDLVVYYNYSAIITLVRKHDLIMSNGGVIEKDCSGIKALRKPRKGGKEARDIVAMLARNGNKKHNKAIKQMKDHLSSYESDLENYDDLNDNYYTDHDLRNLIASQKMCIAGMYRSKRTYGLLSDYRKAKEMLKVQS